MKFSKEIKVALLGVVAIVALYFGYLFLKGSDLFSSTKTYYVVYDNVDGLTVSGPVVLNGIKIGTVQAMQLMPEKNNHIKVALSVKEDLVVGDSTIASLTNSDLLGGKAITLFMGRNNTRYKGGETLIAHTQRSITDMLTAQAMPVLHQVDTALIQLNRFFNEDAKRSIRATILSTQASTEAVRDMLLANQQNINAITTNMASLSTSLRRTEQKFSQLASNLNEITDTLRVTPINSTMRELNATVTEAQGAIQKFNQNTGTIGKLMNNDSLYANMNASTESLDALLKDLKANPKRYVHFSLFGGRTKVEKAENVKTAKKVDEAANVEKAGSVEEVEKK